jgi:hypothetical protein
MLGWADLRETHFESARAHFQQSLHVVRRLGSPGRAVHGLENFARFALAEAQYRRALRLIGAIKMQRAARGVTAGRWPEYDRDIDPSIAPEVLGAAATEAAIAEGSALSLDHAVAYALERPNPLA